MVDPIQRLVAYFDEAHRLADPCANFATFVTVDSDGMPASRVITLRSASTAGFDAWVNSASPKVKQLFANGKWELAGFWPSLMVQFRLRGIANVLRDESITAHWQEQSTESKLADLYHATVRPQSSPISSRAALLAECAKLNEALIVPDFPPDTVARLRLVPNVIEIWKGSLQDWLHDRRLYHLEGSEWSEQILVP